MSNCMEESRVELRGVGSASIGCQPGQCAGGCSWRRLMVEEDSDVVEGLAFDEFQPRASLVEEVTDYGGHREHQHGGIGVRRQCHWHKNTVDTVRRCDVSALARLLDVVDLVDDEHVDAADCPR